MYGNLAQALTKKHEIALNRIDMGNYYPKKKSAV
jgi:hypothetical protein